MNFGTICNYTFAKADFSSDECLVDENYTSEGDKFYSTLFTRFI